MTPQAEDGWAYTDAAVARTYPVDVPARCARCGHPVTGVHIVGLFGHMARLEPCAHVWLQNDGEQWALERHYAQAEQRVAAATPTPQEEAADMPGARDTEPLRVVDPGHADQMTDDSLADAIWDMVSTLAQQGSYLAGALIHHMGDPDTWRARLTAPRIPADVEAYLTLELPASGESARAHRTTLLERYGLTLPTKGPRWYAEDVVSYRGRTFTRQLDGTWHNYLGSAVTKPTQETLDSGHNVTLIFRHGLPVAGIPHAQEG